MGLREGLQCSLRPQSEIWGPNTSAFPESLLEDAGSFHPAPSEPEPAFGSERVPRPTDGPCARYVGEHRRQLVGFLC